MRTIYIYIYYLFSVSVVIDWHKAFYFRECESETVLLALASSFCFCLELRKPVGSCCMTSWPHALNPALRPRAAVIELVMLRSAHAQNILQRHKLAWTKRFRLFWLLTGLLDGEFFLSKWSNSHNRWIYRHQLDCWEDRRINEVSIGARDRTAHLRNKRLLMADSCIHAEIDN